MKWKEHGKRVYSVWSFMVNIYFLIVNMRKYWYLYLVVFISGGSVLAVEILGTRILGPFYGVNLFLWSALISVTLIALSAGYVIGGRWADRGPKISRLCYLLIGAGLWLLLLPIVKQPLLNLAEPFGLRLAVLTSAFILFTPPLTLLGMVSPYAIKLRTSSLGEVGRTAGDLYAISTIGSVLSALLTGFLLIPNVGVARLTAMIGILLSLTAILGLISEKRSTSNLTASGVLLIVVLGAFGFMPAEQAQPQEGFIAVEQSPYAELKVLEIEDHRYLLIDGGTHTIVDPKTWESFFPYVALIDLTREFYSAPGKMLLIGLGGGSVMKNFARENWDVTGVEIDPKVIQMAGDYFGLKESEGEVFCQDGRQFLISHEDSYDLIVMDAFGSSSIPFHLVTKEAFGLIGSRLNKNGVLAINLESRSWDDLLVRSLTATLKSNFSEVMVLPAHKDADGLGNMVVFAANRTLKRSKQPPQWDIPPRDYLQSMDYRQDFGWQNRFEPNIGEAPVLTDDLNPVDIWAEAINLEARKKLHQFFEPTGLYE